MTSTVSVQDGVLRVVLLSCLLGFRSSAMFARFQASRCELQHCERRLSADKGASIQAIHVLPNVLHCLHCEVFSCGTVSVSWKLAKLALGVFVELVPQLPKP